MNKSIVYFLLFFLYIPQAFAMDNAHASQLISSLCHTSQHDLDNKKLAKTELLTIMQEDIKNNYANMLPEIQAERVYAYLSLPKETCTEMMFYENLNYQERIYVQDYFNTTQAQIADHEDIHSLEYIHLPLTQRTIYNFNTYNDHQKIALENHFARYMNQERLVHHKYLAHQLLANKEIIAQPQKTIDYKLTLKPYIDQAQKQATIQHQEFLATQEAEKIELCKKEQRAAKKIAYKKSLQALREQKQMDDAALLADQAHKIEQEKKQAQQEQEKKQAQRKLNEDNKNKKEAEQREKLAQQEAARKLQSERSKAKNQEKLAQQTIKKTSDAMDDFAAIIDSITLNNEEQKEKEVVIENDCSTLHAASKYNQYIAWNNQRNDIIQNTEKTVRAQCMKNLPKNSSYNKEEFNARVKSKCNAQYQKLFSQDKQIIDIFKLYKDALSAMHLQPHSLENLEKIQAIMRTIKDLDTCLKKNNQSVSWHLARNAELYKSIKNEYLHIQSLAKIYTKHLEKRRSESVTIAIDPNLEPQERNKLVDTILSVIDKEHHCIQAAEIIKSMHSINGILDITELIEISIHPDDFQFYYALSQEQLATARENIQKILSQVKKTNVRLASSEPINHKRKLELWNQALHHTNFSHAIIPIFKELIIEARVQPSVQLIGSMINHTIETACNSSSILPENYDTTFNAMNITTFYSLTRMNELKLNPYTNEQMIDLAKIYTLAAQVAIDEIQHN